MQMADDSNAQRVYCTNAKIVTTGRAVAVDLNDATLPGMVNNKHMTILFRRNGQWTEDEIAAIAKETDNWIKAKYGRNSAPVTFSIEQWGNKSVKIAGDLNELCIYLRKHFSALSSDKQRIPHCEVFKNKDKKNKNCHVCKQSGNKREECPRKLNNKKMKKSDFENGDKLKVRMERIIKRTKALRMRKERELKLLAEKEGDLVRLMNEYNLGRTMDDKALKVQIRQIAKSFKMQRKEMKKCDKKQRKKEKKWRKKEKKMARRERKQWKKKCKNGAKNQNDKIAVFVEDEQKEQMEVQTVNDIDDDFVEVDAETIEESENDSNESSTVYSEEGVSTTRNDDEFDLIFEGFE